MVGPGVVVVVTVVRALLGLVVGGGVRVMWSLILRWRSLLMPWVVVPIILAASFGLAAAQTPLPVQDSSVDYELELLNASVSTLVPLVATQTAGLAELRGLPSAGVPENWRLTEVREGSFAITRVLAGIAALLVVLVSLQVVVLVVSFGSRS